MLLLLPMLALGSLLLIAWERGFSWRLSVLLAATAWGLLLLVITEGLSAFHFLSWAGVAICWACVCMVALVWLICHRSNLGVCVKSRAWRWQLDGSQSLLLLAVGVMLVALAIIARRSPPQNYDSYTYHLPRVLHWIQDRSVAFFPTHNYRQVTQPPFAEYVVLQTMILTGDDNWANLVQWLAMIGSLIAISQLAMRLGAGVRGQLLSVMICATIPMGILQATTTQNNYVAGFWLITGVALGWEVLRHGAYHHSEEPPRRRQGTVPWLLVAATSTALGLALLTKAVAYVFAFPFCLLFAIGVFRYRWKAVPILLLIAMVTMALNTLHYVRNYRLSGYPLGPPTESFAGPYLNADFTWRSATSNTIRNVAIELGTPWKVTNVRIEHAARVMHRWLDLNPDEPRWTWGKHTFEMPWLWNHDDLAGSPIHMLLIVAACPLLFLLKSGQRNIALLYLGLLLMGAEMFSLLLRWQVYSNRLLLPLLMLASPVVGMALERACPRWLASATMVLLFMQAVPVVIDNYTTPLMGSNGIFKIKRVDQRFHGDHVTRRRYQQIAEAVRTDGCQDVGLVIGSNIPEYPMWVMLQQRIHNVRIEHVGVNNFTAALRDQLPFRNFTPCIVIEIKSLEDVRFWSVPSRTHIHKGT